MKANTKKQGKITKAVKAVKKAAKVAKDSFIKLTHKTMNADITQTAIAFFWLHNRVRSDCNEMLAEWDSLNLKSGKSVALYIEAFHGEGARDGELDTTGKFLRVRNYGAGGVFTGWFNIKGVLALLAGTKFTFYTDALALAKTFKHFEQRRAAGSGESYVCAMSNDLSKKVYAASVRKLSSGRLIAWTEEAQRNGHNAHEVSATEKEIARKAVLGS